MKRIFLSIALMVVIGTSVFAAGSTGTEVSQLVLQSFQKEFSAATNVKWEQRGQFTKVTFTLNDQVLFAYYNEEGERTAVVRNILSNQLPISLLSALKNDYTRFWISDLFEMASDGNTTYYVTIENADKKIVLRSSGLDGWAVYSKSRKDTE